DVTYSHVHYFVVNDTATTELYTLSLHDALPILAKANIEKFHAAQRTSRVETQTMPGVLCWQDKRPIQKVGLYVPGGTAPLFSTRSEEHTSELQSRENLVCRLLLEKKK